MENETVSTPKVATAEKKAPVKLTISALREDLKNGITRKEQAKKYGVPLAAITRAYKNEKLKGKRVFSSRGSKATNIELIDDVQDEKTPKATEGQETVGSTQVSENTSVPEPSNEASIETQPEVGTQEAPKSDW